jgi:hypothetical protein
MNKKFSLFLILLLGLNPLTCSAVSASVVGNDEYDLYSFIIESQFIKPSIKRIVIENQTIEGLSLGKLLFNDNFETLLLNHNLDTWNTLKFEFWNKSLGVEQETLDDFASKAEQIDLLSKHFKLSVPYSLISLESLQKIFRPSAYEGWEAFYKKYPDSSGIISFSRIGFNKRKDQALVYVDVSRCSRWMEGSYMLFFKVKNKWVLRTKKIVMQA